MSHEGHHDASVSWFLLCHTICCARPCVIRTTSGRSGKTRPNSARSLKLFSSFLFRAKPTPRENFFFTEKIETGSLRPLAHRRRKRARGLARREKNRGAPNLRFDLWLLLLPSISLSLCSSTAEMSNPDYEKGLGFDDKPLDGTAAQVISRGGPLERGQIDEDGIREGEDLHRGLKARQISMIAIGTSLFLAAAGVIVHNFARCFSVAYFSLAHVQLALPGGSIGTGLVIGSGTGLVSVSSPRGGRKGHPFVVFCALPWLTRCFHPLAVSRRSSRTLDRVHR